MATKRVTERFAFSGGKVCRDGPVPYVEGVLICGFESANGRDYKPKAWAGDRVKRYENRPVYVNHANHRAAESKLGWFEKVGLRDDGRPQGRFCLNPKHPLAESVLWAAENKPDFYGMSHVADCDVTPGPGGRETIEDVLKVESIDLVADPATTKGLFEGRGYGVSTIKKLAEWVARHPGSTTAQITRAKRLAEMDGMADVAMDAPADDADPEEGITAAFEAAIMSVVRAAMAKGMDKKTVLKKVGALIDGHDEAQNAAADTGGNEPDEPDEPGTKESRGAFSAKALTEAADQMDREKITGLSYADLVSLSFVPKGRRVEMARRIAGGEIDRGAEHPESVSREGTGRRRAEGRNGSRNGTHAAPAADGKEFLSRILG